MRVLKTFYTNERQKHFIFSKRIVDYTPLFFKSILIISFPIAIFFSLIKHSYFRLSIFV